MQDMRPLLQVMTEEKDIHRMLLDIAIQKKDVLIRNEVNVLNGIVVRERQLVILAGELEDQRQQLVMDLAGHLDIAGEALSFAKVIELCDEPLKNEFADLKKELGDIVLQLKQNNEINKRLLLTHMDYSSFCIRMLTDTGEGQTYNNKGGTNGDPSVNFRIFDQRV